MICKVCKEEKENILLHDIFGLNKYCMCYSCFISLNPQIRNYRIKGFRITTLYDYKSKMKEIIYLFKGCYDYELKDVFLDYYYELIIKKYRGYCIASVPSNKEEDEKRGFNHVEEIFKCLPIKTIKCFSKKKYWKQSDCSFEERKKIRDIIEIDSMALSKIKKILIVDDIVTSGNTLLACANLVRKNRIKKIKLLAIAKVSKGVNF